MRRSCSSPRPDRSAFSIPKKPGRTARAFALLAAIIGCECRRRRPCQSGALHLVSARFGDPFRGRHKDAVVAQLVRAPVCGTGGRWFEPTQLYQPSSLLIAGRCLEPLQYRQQRTEIQRTDVQPGAESDAGFVKRRDVIPVPSGETPANCRDLLQQATGWC